MRTMDFDYSHKTFLITRRRCLLFDLYSAASLFENDVI